MNEAEVVSTEQPIRSLGVGVLETVLVEGLSLTNETRPIEERGRGASHIRSPKQALAEDLPAVHDHFPVRETDQVDLPFPQAVSADGPDRIGSLRDLNHPRETV